MEQDKASKLPQRPEPGTAAARRRLPVGAEYHGDRGASFRVWAPLARAVEVVVGEQAWPLAAQDGGYFAGEVREARPGMHYRFRLDGGDALPDPASRFQPEGPHGPSEIVDPGSFDWTDAAWPGLRPQGQVLYEVHVGTFTREGTYAAAAEHFAYLKDLGITCIALMPVNEFAGPFGWGYDGVHLFAPTHLYGRPDDLRRFVDRAHAAGMGVILDVVYDHFGPSGNDLPRFSSSYTGSGNANEWGEPVNFDGQGSAPVREFFIANAGAWIDEFHFDGLRIGATQCIVDSSQPHVLAEMVQRTRKAAGRRSVFLTAQNGPQHGRLARAPGQGGFGFDALWNDDFHHSAMAAASGLASETRGTPQELISAVKWGFLYQGQFDAWQGSRRGQAALDLPSRAFVTFLQNHDQVANSVRGERLHALAAPGRLRALTALWLLAPGTPMFFQGQEFAASSPFLYFARHGDELDALMGKGRAEFLSQFPGVGNPQGLALLPSPSDAATFERCKLDHAERARGRHADALRLHRDLLRLRKGDRVFAMQDGSRVHGAVLGPEAFLLRYLGDRGEDDRLVVVNLGATLPLRPMPEPLLAPPEGLRWTLLWHSEDPQYGGSGMREPDGEHSWCLPPHALAVLKPGRLPQDGNAAADA